MFTFIVIHILHKKRESLDPDFDKSCDNPNKSINQNQDQGQKKYQHCLPHHHNAHDDHTVPDWVTAFDSSGAFLY